jgi:dolichol-phosphate mannosyltransferase
MESTLNTSFQDRVIDPAKRPLVSIVTPAYNEAQNLPELYKRLSRAMDAIAWSWEWIVVDDHSQDETFAVISALAQHDPRVRGLRFARNSGSHAAIACGLHHTRGDCATVLAADLQDPPEVMRELLERWRGGAQVVWVVRAKREGESRRRVITSRLYYLLMQRILGDVIPTTGADFVLLDRRVVEAFCQFRESNTSILALITWMGFRQESIVYDKHARLHGCSGWSLKKKLKLVVDSVTSFSYFPVRAMSYTGFIVALLGFGYTAVVLVNALIGQPVHGWSSLMIVVLVVGGIQMIMMGVLGEYLWRALDESRRRPRYLIEDVTPVSPGIQASSEHEAAARAQP